jgi:hypothetical protein
MHRNVVFLILVLGVPLASCGPSPGTPATAEMIAFEPEPPKLEGVWHRKEIQIDGGPDAGLHMLDVQPSIYIFSNRHYAVAAVEGFTPRRYLGENPTDADRGAAFIPYTGEMGAYVETDGKLELTPVVSKNPAEMNGVATRAFDIVWDEIDVWLVSRASDGVTTRMLLTRIDDDVRLATRAAQRLVGVWRRAEMVVGSGPDAGTHVDDAQPGFYIFSPRSFVGTYVSAFAPRAPLGDNPTLETMGRNYQSYVSFAGTHTLRDGKLVLTPVVSQNPNDMRGPPYLSIDVEWEGEDVWFIYTNSAGTQNRTRLVRVPD